MIEQIFIKVVESNRQDTALCFTYVDFELMLIELNAYDKF